MKAMNRVEWIEDGNEDGGSRMETKTVDRGQWIEDSGSRTVNRGQKRRQWIEDSGLRTETRTTD